MTDHERYREWVGPYLLGALEPDERTELETHLDTCDSCRGEIISLSAIPGLLRAISEPALAQAPSREIGAAAMQIIQHDRHRLERTTRRWRVTALASVAVLAVFVTLALRPSPEPEPSLPDASLAFEGAVAGEVRLTARGWGVAIDAELNELPDDSVYELWIVTSDGDRERAASWGPTDQNRAHLWGSSSLDFDRVSAVEIWSGGANELIGTAWTTDT